ncbi:MAG: MarR family transcriptional regulator [Spirochaetaceae bacterium]|nr:MarR family transcriptional regulator [Spirochaetaceae bacterium]
MSGSNNRENQTEASYDSLLLQNQLCFPLYACAKEIVRRYKPFLDEIDLTYTQYIAMMVLWEEKSVNVKELGEKLFLDSGTLTPLLKILEKKQYVKRERSQTDERVVNITITEKGLALREKAVSIPAQMSGCVKITKEEAQTLYSLLYKILRQTGN